MVVVILLLPIVTSILVASNVIIFVLTHYYTNDWYKLGSIPAYMVSDVYTFIITTLTSMFVHANIVHIAFNMLALVALGRVIEGYLGSYRYIMVYILSGITGVIMHTIYSIVTSSNINTPMIGASGAVSGIIGLAAVLGDRFAYIWLALQFVFIVAGLSSIAYFAHIGGFVFGFVVGRLMYRRYDIV